MSDLFTSIREPIQEIYPQVWLLANYFDSSVIEAEIPSITAASPFRKMMTPMGHYTGIALTNCGDFGWVSDRNGYRYVTHDPLNGMPWPPMPEVFSRLATRAAESVGFSGFKPDAGLINQYLPGTRLSAHQDKNESDFRWPIVSLSLGLPATFQIFGHTRTGKPVECTLLDGDVLVWGGSARLVYHGVKTIKPDPQNPGLDSRYNVTLRRAG
jgi:DNA oxidative demethylase